MNEWPSNTIEYTGFNSYACNQYGNDVASLSRRLSRLKWMARLECSPDGINSHISMHKTKVGGHWLWFDLERNGFCQVYLPKTHYTWMNISLALNPDIWKGTHQVLTWTVSLLPNLIMGLMMMMIYELMSVFLKISNSILRK